MRTLESRIKALVEGTSNAINPGISSRWRIWGNSSKGFTVSLRHDIIREGEYKGLTKPPEGHSLIASIVVELARHHEAKAGWQTFSIDYDHVETRIVVRKKSWLKVSETLVGVDKVNYNAIKGFTAETNSDLQLFGGQGLNAADTCRLLAAI